MDQAPVQCEFCGSTIPADRPMCQACRAPRPVQPAPEEAAAAPKEAAAKEAAAAAAAAAAFPPTRPPAGARGRFERIEHRPTSRWAKGATTMGPVPKVIITIVILVALGFTYFLMKGLLAAAPALMVLFIPFVAVLLFFVWRKDQIAEDP